MFVGLVSQARLQARGKTDGAAAFRTGPIVACAETRACVDGVGSSFRLL